MPPKSKNHFTAGRDVSCRQRILYETNNTLDTALNAIAPALTGTRTRLEVAVQDRCSEIVCLR